ncbi:MAG: hypothetical protein JRI25_06655 [Deltaproteobacteria bacterium]|nr:hypothetical protein [Deltaproteobacteria bacterium]
MSRWPGVLADPEQEVLLRRLELGLGWLEQPVRDRIAGLLTSLALPNLFLGRAMLWGASLAGLTGSVPLEARADGALVVQPPKGPTFLLVPLVFHTQDVSPGPAEAVQRLVDSLEGAFGDRPFALHLRRSLSPEFDSDAVFRAVQLWVRAVSRGEWRGRHAIYDDDQISLELTLIDAVRRREGQSLTFFMGPTVSLHRLAVVDSHLQEMARQYASEELPLVGLLAANPRWGLTRGYVCQLLFGTPDKVVTRGSGGPGTHLATYGDDRYSLFADPQFRRLAALWWVEPAEGDPIGVTGTAHENPWRAAGVLAPPFPGTRFRPFDAGEEAPENAVMMTWEPRHTSTWRGPE